MNHGSLPTTSFRDLHHGDSPLLPPNAWDVASAVASAEAGFRAVGTTSFGVGAAAGHADGARASRDATAALTHALAIPDLPLEKLAELGICRVSTGSLPYRAALDAAVGVATAVRDGDPPVVATPYKAAQQSLVRFVRRAIR